jgi:hypothetical protein
MRTLKPAAYAIGIAAAISALSACGGGASPSLETVSSREESKPGLGKSWMAPRAKRSDLLYVSNTAGGNVTVYSWSSTQLVGTITGLSAPTGLCVDSSGDVFVTADGTQQILEYEHGTTSPVATLNDPDGYPYGCSVDPNTGDLAVTNYVGLSGAAGNLLIFPNASGAPSEYNDSAMMMYYFPAFDDRGNLFVDGFTSRGAFAFAELPSGGSGLVDLALNRSIVAPGGVQWDGKYVAVGDPTTDSIYEFTIAGSTGTLERTTSLGGALQIPQFWIPRLKGGRPDGQSRRVVGTSSSPLHGGVYSVLSWTYPSGGSPSKTITNGLNGVSDVTLSQAFEERGKHRVPTRVSPF